MKTAEEILAEWTHTYPEIKKYVIKAMEAYASQQIEKYKELIEVMNELYPYLGILRGLTDKEFDAAMYLKDKIEQLKTELGL